MKIHQNSKKFNYNIQTINTDFNDFINLCSFQNDENKNIENIPNNIVSSIPNFFNQENINDNSNSDKTFRKFYPNNKNKYIIVNVFPMVNIVKIVFVQIVKIHPNLNH